MEAKVIRKVNSRIEANTSSVKLNPLSVGETIAVKGWKFGESFQGNKVWLQDEHDIHYWSGAFDFDFSSVVFSKSSTFNSLGIQEMWKYSMGESIKVGIIDCGIDIKNKALVNSSISVKGGTGVPNCNHGNYMSSIICGTAIEDGFVGIVPNAQIQFSPLGDIEKSSPANLLSCLTSLKDCDIINMSFATDTTPFKPRNNQSADLIKYLKGQSAVGKIFVAASGNNGIQTGFQYYPASYDGVISVSGFNVKSQDITDDANFWRGISIVGAYDPFFDLANNAKENFGNNLAGTSVTSAVTTAIFALILSKYNRANMTKPSKVELLRSFTKDIKVVNKSGQIFNTSVLDKESILNFLKQ
jgi:subtilisin family serine protease